MYIIVGIMYEFENQDPFHLEQGQHLILFLMFSVNSMILRYIQIINICNLVFNITIN